MIHTPLSFKTTEELVNDILTSEEPTWLELELAQRIDALRDEIEDLKNVYSPDAHRNALRNVVPA